MEKQNAQKPISEVPQHISPSVCRPWRFHNRSTAWTTTEQQRSLEQSIAKDGQQQPGLVRVLEGDSNFQYEIVFGMRRCLACGSEGKPFLAKIVPANTSDQACARLMHIENEERANVSVLERAKNYAALIEGGVFEEQTELATELGLTKSRVSQLLKAAEIFDYPWLAALIEPGLIHVSIRSATQLARRLNNPVAQRLLRDRAGRLAELSESLGVEEIIKQLLATVPSGKSSPVQREVLERVGRQPVVEIARTRDGAVQVSIAKVERSLETTEELISQIAEKMRAYLIDENAVSSS